MRPFDQLTKYGRARRLRRIAWRAIEAYDIDVVRLRLVNNEANCTFRVDASDGSSYALRINLPAMRSAAEIRSELTWQEALWTDTDIAVPRPIRARDGDLVVAASDLGVPEERLCNLSSWVYGKTFSRSRSDENFVRLGRLAAALHRHGEAFDPPAHFTVPLLDAAIPPDRPNALIEGGLVNDLPVDARTLIIEMNDVLTRELARLFRPGQRPRLIHGDLHWWNVLVYRGSLRPIDFEDCVWGHPIQDIAITFYYVLWDERFPAFLGAFRRGYESIQPWPEKYEGQLDLLLGLRALDLLNLLMTSPYPDERELIPEYTRIIHKTYRPHFDRWKSLQH